MKKLSAIVLLTLFTTQLTIGQNSNNTSRFSNTVSNLYSGFISATEWYDIPIAGALIAKYHLDENKIGNAIHIGPSLNERDINNSIRHNNADSFGSINKDYYPNYIFAGRLLYNSAISLLTDANVPSTTFRNIFLFKKAVMYTYILTEYTKTFVKRYRPNSQDTRSFFSGHTSTTFATSTYLFLELNEFYKNWSLTKNNTVLRNIFKISTFGTLYGWAGYVGYSRLKDNKHYLTDVLVGASVGTLISMLVYNLYSDESEADGIFKSVNVNSGQNQSLNLSFSIKLF